MSLVETGKAFLEHYGVKGQRWGVRRTQSTLDKAAGRQSDSGGSSKSGGGKGSDSGKNSRNPKKSVYDMSDKELKDVVNRMNMEQQFAKMQPTPFSRKAAGFAASIAATAAKQALQTEANKRASSLLGDLMDRRIKVSRAGGDAKAISAELTKVTKAANWAAPQKYNITWPAPSASDKRG